MSRTLCGRLSCRPALAGGRFSFCPVGMPVVVKGLRFASVPAGRPFRPPLTTTGLLLGMSAHSPAAVGGTAELVFLEDGQVLGD